MRPRSEADLVGRQRGQPDAEDAGDAERQLAREALALPRTGRRGVERRQALRRRGRLPSVGARPARGRPAPSRSPARAPRAPARRPPSPARRRSAMRNAGRCARGRPAHRRRRSGSRWSACSSSARRCGSAGGTRMPSTPSRDDVGVARDLGGDHRRSGREGLGQDHPEALAGQRRRAENVRLMEPAPQARSPETCPARRCAPRRGVGQVALDVVASAPMTVSRAGTCSTRPSKAWSSTGSPLRSSGRPTKSTRNSSDSGLGPTGGGVDVDAVRDHAVSAAEPAAPGPGGRLGHGDPRVKLVELPPRAERVRDPVGQRLGRVRVECADDRGAAERARVPADERGPPASGRERRRTPRREARGASCSRRNGRRRGWRRRRWRRSPTVRPSGTR